MKSFWGDNPFPSSSDLLLGSFLLSDLWLALSRPTLTPAAEAGQHCCPVMEFLNFIKKLGSKVST